MPRSLNFNAGPATLPLPALERAQRELVDFAGTGASVMELSHRGPEYEAVHDEALALLRRLGAIPDTHEILLLQGGASLQFASIPLNFLPAGRSADYVVTGAWGEKAIAEARTIAALGGGAPRLALSTGEGPPGEQRFARVPDPSEVPLDPAAAYVHVTSNETIHGVQYATAPGAPLPGFGAAPLVVDMSSDFMWRPMDLSRVDFAYAGAQKNVGPSGIVIVVARRAFLDGGRRDLPAIMQYRTHAANRSLYNTPPTFSVYLIRNVLDWVDGLGGLATIEARNRRKAALLYGAIERHAGFYRCPVAPGSRSLMNVVFRLPEPALEDRFVAAAKRAGMLGVKGHRTVGGLRISLYNAVEPAWVEALVALMDEFVRTDG